MSIAIKRLLVPLGLLLTVAAPAGAVTYTLATPISGDAVSVTVALSDTAGGDAVDVTVSIPPGAGDLLGLFGNVVGESLVPAMGVEDPSGLITQWQFQANQVWKVGGGNTMAPVKSWDWGLRIGENGSAGGAVESASFRLTGPGLTGDQVVGAVNQGWVLGVRIQETSGPEGSSKMGLSGEAPRIRITDPEDGALLAATPTEVLGTVLGSGVAVDVNGTSAQVSGGAFSADVPLSEGQNTLTATGVNASGTATDSIDVVLDTTAPLVAITAPEDGTITAETSILVTGTVTDASPIQSVTLNGQGVALVDGAFSAMVDLPSLGTHTITAVALDAAGHEGSDSIQVTRGEPPTLAIETPADGSLLSVSPVIVTGTVTGLPEPTVVVAGIPAAVSGGSFTATVPLVEGAQTIAASATNALGSASDEVLVTLDTLPPVVVITGPADGARTTEPSVVVSGTVSDASPIASFTVAGETVGLAGDGSFTTTVPLDLGERLITAQAVDAAGHSGSASVTVTRGEVPSIVIASPSDGAFLGSGAVEVTGTVSGTAPVAVTVAGVAASVVGGSFSASVSLPEDSSTLTAVATNDFGSASNSVDVTVDTTPPVVSITVPTDGAELTEEPIGVIGEVTDASPIVGLALNGSPTAPGNAFAETVALTEGPNTITVEATDAAGNVGADSVTVTFSAGGAPLAVSIETPPHGALVSQATIAVAGSVSDPAASVQVNGVVAAVSGTHYVAAAVRLTEGENLLTATATRGSESASDSRTVVFNVPPQVVITSPDDGAVLRVATTDVAGVVDDPTAFVDVNGVVASVESAGRFVARGVPLEPGENELRARAIDPLGAQGRDSVSVTRDDAAAGHVRLVVVDGNNRWVGSAGMASFSNLEEYLLNLSRGEYSPWYTPPIDEITLERFSPPIDVPTVFPQLEMYVLAEDPGDASIAAWIEGEAVPFAGPESQALLPIEELDSYLYLPGLAVPEAFAPEEFEPRYFASFWDLFSGCFPDDCGPSDLLAAARLVLRGEVAPVQDEMAVYADFTHPQVVIQSPEMGSVIAGNTVTVTGAVYDEGPLLDVVWYQVRDEYDVVLDEGSAGLLVEETEPVDPWNLPIRGRFTIPDLILGTGFHTIEVRAWDTLGQPNYEITYVESDPNAPPVTLISPLDGQAFLAENAVVDLNFAAETTLVAVNGEPDGRSFAPGLATGALSVPLELGANSFLLELESGGVTFHLGFTLFRVEELTPIAITQPAAGALVNTPTVTVRGLAPLGTPYVDVNGIPATFADDRVSFTAEVPVVPGKNAIRAVAPFGDPVAIEIRADFLPPRLLVVVPEDGSATSETALQLAGAVSEKALLELSGPGGLVTGRTGTSPFGGFAFGLESSGYRFELAPLDLVDGENPLELRLRDGAGNETVETLTVLRTGAGLLLVSPAEGTSVPALRTDLTLQALEDVTITAWYAAGRRLPALEGASLTTGFVTVSNIPLVPGANEMRVVYQRAGGPPETLAFEVESTATEVATVTGTVTDAQRGTPLEGALVKVVVNGVTLVVPTASDGSYTVEVEPGAVAVSIEREGFLEWRASGAVAAGETFVAGASLISWSVGGGVAPSDPGQGATSTVAGTVTDQATGEPLEGALILVTQGSTTLSAITDSSGTYDISEIPVGDLEIVVTRVGFFPQLFTVSTAEPVYVPLDPALVAIPESVTLVGTVVDMNTGESVPDIRVDVLGSEIAVRADETGSFLIEGLPLGWQTLRFRRAEFLDEFIFMNVEPDPSANPIERTFWLTFAQSPQGTRAVAPDATGRVIDRFTLEPIVGASVEGRSLVTGQVTGSAVTDAEGAFTLAGLEPFDTIEVTATSSGHEPQSLSAYVVPKGDEILDFYLRSEAEGRVQGTVTDSVTGEPVFLAEVRLASGGLATASEGDGSYGLIGVPPGTHTLEVVHPRYFPETVPAVAVAPDTATPLSVSLAPRPTTGGLTGVVRDAVTGAPVAGAVLSGPDGASATVDTDGQFQLSHIPAGLVEISIAADGFPVQSRSAVVDADLDAANPTVREADLLLTADGSFTVEASATVPTTGGSVELPDGSFRLGLPPLGLSGDAVVTIRRVSRPDVVSGAAPPLDPDLELPPLIALGGAIEIQIESATPGETAPFFAGPLLVSARYSASAAQALGILESGIAPAYYDEDRGLWTFFRIVPHLHAVDEVNRQVVIGLSPIDTETGGPVTARLHTPQPVQLAGFPNLPVIRTLRKVTLALVAKLKEALPAENGEILPISPSEFGGNLQAVQEWDLNAMPLLVFHGWDKRTMVFDNRTMSLPEVRASRYFDMMLDLARATNGVYRPVFVTYNPRMGLEAIGSKIRQEVEEGLSGDLRGEPADPTDPETAGRFPYFDSFGFSMGGLSERAYQSQHAPQGSINAMVTMGSPHHGGLQVVRMLGAALLPGLDALLGAWSPGTADLLDYSDSLCRVEPLLSGNDTMCRMNRDPGSAPDQRLSLIAGVNSTRLSELYPDFSDAVPDPKEFEEGLEALQQASLDPDLEEVEPGLLDELASRGFALTGSLESDGVVPVWSAHARTGPWGEIVPALSHVVAKKPSKRFFDHFNAGKDGQRIDDYVDDDILPILSDWIVSRAEGPPQVEPPGSGTQGSFFQRFQVEFNVHHESVTHVLPVLYGQYLEDGNPKWKILSGVVDSEGKPDTNLAKEIKGNSRSDGAVDLDFDVEIDPATWSEIRWYQPLVVRLGRSTLTVPPEPPDDAFYVPVPPSP